MDVVNKLSSNLQSQLRSDLMARSVSSCVIELVENALDADAKNIAVRINLETFHLEVVDDGTGLTKDQLELVGERYYTSKSEKNPLSNSTRSFGSRGEGLASIKNVSSSMLIISLVPGGDTTYCKRFNGSSKEVSKSHIDRKTHGTTVIVENVLGNISVRQKCTKAHVELQTIQRYIRAIALMFPMVNFSIRDDTKKSEMLKITRTYSTTSTFTAIFPGAVKDPSSIVKVSSKHESLTVKAMISREICNTDQLQFIFVNKQYISPQNEIQNFLNQLLNKILPSKDKSVSQKAVYVVNLSCPREMYDMSLESDKRNVVFKSWQTVKTCLRNLVNQLITDESTMIEDEIIPKKKDRPIFVAKDAFHKLNSLNTVYGLPASRKNLQDKSNDDEFIIDDKSTSSSENLSSLRKQTPSKRLRNPQAQRNVKKIPPHRKVPKDSQRTSKITAKQHKSPRLADQGIELTYVKSPKKVAKKDKTLVIPEMKTSTENLNSESNDYAWIWKHNAKKRRNLGKVDNSNEEGNAQIREKPSDNKKTHCRVHTKDEKSRTNDNPDHVERYKNITALSYQRMLKRPGDERISKKQNHYFDDDKAEQADFIVKYGFPKKKLERVNESEEPKSNDFQTQESSGFDVYEKFVAKGRSNNRTAVEAEEDHALPDTLIPTQIISPNAPSQLIVPKLQTKIDVVEFDYKRKVTDWIDSLPSNENFINHSNDDGHFAPSDGCITPTNPPLTQEISEEFATKNKISKTPTTDHSEFTFNNRTPEKSKPLRFDNFISDGKLLKNSRSQRHESLNQIHQKRNARVSKPLFKWSPRPISKRTAVDEILQLDSENSVGSGHKENHVIADVQHSQNSAQPVNHSKPGDQSMSWKCSDDNCAENAAPENIFARKNDTLSDIKNLTNFSQESEKSCPNDCACKCHRQKKKKISVRLFDDETEKSKCQLPDPKVSSDDDIFEQSLASDRLDPDLAIYITNDDTEFAVGELETVSQHFGKDFKGSRDNSKYFNPESELMKKLRFKQNSKFFESSSVLDIPEGMMKVQKEDVKIDKLTDGEKKLVGDLVKPYSMQKHITLDDSGNSCLRIFPFLKKGVEQLAIPDTNKGTDDLNCGVIFTKADISSFTFTDQVENQFILASATLKSSQTPLLILLDQHAVDERIRVEQLFNEYKNEEEWLSTPINPPINLNVPASYSSLFTDYQSYLEEFGITYQFKNNQKKLLISFTKVPTCFYNKAMREKNNFRVILKSSIESLMKEILNQFTTQGTLVQATPVEFQNVLNSEACRGAVKFGDKLTPQICVALLEGLKLCNLPFQCAHGRPTVIPLVNLEKLKHLEVKIRKPTLDSIKKSLNRIAQA